MRSLNELELAMVSGGTDTRPSCSNVTNGNGTVTVCTCPSGTTPAAGTLGNTVIVRCVSATEAGPLKP